MCEKRNDDERAETKLYDWKRSCVGRNEDNRGEKMCERKRESRKKTKKYEWKRVFASADEDVGEEAKINILQNSDARLERNMSE